MGGGGILTDKIEKKIRSVYMPDESLWDFQLHSAVWLLTSVEEITTHTRRYPMGGGRGGDSA